MSFIDRRFTGRGPVLAKPPEKDRSVQREQRQRLRSLKTERSQLEEKIRVNGMGITKTAQIVSRLLLVKSEITTLTGRSPKAAAA